MTAPAPTVYRWTEPREREHAIAAAVEALKAGELVVLPTETVYGLFACASSRRSVDRLRELAPADNESPWSAAWHAASASALLAKLPEASEMHRWLIDRLSPGPVAFVLPAEHPDAGRLAELLSADAGSDITLRVPSDATALEVLEQVGEPVIGIRLAAAAVGDGASVGPALDDHELLTDASPSAADLGAQVLLDAGPTRHRDPSTVLRLLSGSPGYEIVREGVYSAESIQRRLPRRILFVCTGNTCRSPLAQAIARELVESSPIPTVIESAGVAAANGAPATDDAINAGGDLGLDLTGHRAQQVDRALLRSADAIFTMTTSHADALYALDPDLDPDILIDTLDPDGQDVPDPIGQGLEVYRATADRLRSLIASRLQELTP